MWPGTEEGADGLAVTGPEMGRMCWSGEMDKARGAAGPLRRLGAAGVPRERGNLGMVPEVR